MSQGESHREAGAATKATLYVVATPIGNLRDITLRALDVLADVDAIACEDTRVTSILLERYGISKRLIALHQHNERATAQKIVALLESGKAVAYVCDAGTPAISDPGAGLVATVRASGLAVVGLPGANAAVNAFSITGFECERLLIYGFLPAQSAARKRELDALKALPYVLAIYEAPHRVEASVRDLVLAFGEERRVALARELTKLFETVHVGRLGELGAWLEADANRRRGEFVLLIDAPNEAPATDQAETRRLLAVLVAELPLNQAVKLAVRLTGEPRNRLYPLALQIKGETP